MGEVPLYGVAILEPWEGIYLSSKPRERIALGISLSSMSGERTPRAGEEQMLTLQCNADKMKKSDPENDSSMATKSPPRGGG